MMTMDRPAGLDHLDAKGVGCNHRLDSAAGGESRAVGDPSGLRSDHWLSSPPMLVKTVGLLQLPPAAAEKETVRPQMPR